MAGEENHNQLRRQVEEMFNGPAEPSPLRSLENLLAVRSPQSEIDSKLPKLGMQNKPDQPLSKLVKDMDKYILQCMGRSVHVTSLSGQIIYWNSMAEQLFGYSVEQAVGQKGLDLLCNQHAHELATRIGASIRMGNSWCGQFPLRTRDGREFMALVSVSPLIHVQGEVLGVITVSSPLNLLPSGDSQPSTSQELTSQGHSGLVWLPKPETSTAVQQQMHTLSTGGSSAQPWSVNENVSVTGASCSSSWCERRNPFLVPIPDPDPQLQSLDFEIPWTELKLRLRIGEGSCGTVYHGSWLGSDVAVKMFVQQAYSPQVLEDFKREVSIMKAVRHPNILLFMGAVTQPEHLSIITEFLPRGSLFRLLHRNSQDLSWLRRINMALDVAMGMNYLHHQTPQIIHCDIKSSNLLVNENWKVKIGDFGLSRRRRTGFLTRLSDRGTAQWMAPEVLRNERFNEKSDVYSFGVILWELATRRVPWDDMSLLEVMGAVGMLERTLEIPEKTNPQYAQLMTSCLSVDPELRPSFDTVVFTLKQIRSSIRLTQTQMQG